MPTFYIMKNGFVVLPSVGRFYVNLLFYKIIFLCVSLHTQWNKMKASSLKRNLSNIKNEPLTKVILILFFLIQISSWL